MRTMAEEMLSRINAEIKLLNYDNDITANDALHMVKFITPLYSLLRKLVSDYAFPTNEDEILFFKEIKPNILDKYLYFSKVYSIEMKCPIGNNEIIKEYFTESHQVSGLQNGSFFFLGGGSKWRLHRLAGWICRFTG